MIGVLLIVACTGAPGPAPVPMPAPTEVAAPEPAPAPEAALVHPGTVVFVDLDEGTSHEEPASSLPETIAWVTVDGVPVPVTRVESRKRGEAREITKYAADGRALQTTVSAPPRPR